MQRREREWVDNIDNRRKRRERRYRREMRSEIEEREIFCIYAVGVRIFLWEFRDSNPRNPAWNGTYRLATGTGA
jgi:hypothetical protein